MLANYHLFGRRKRTIQNVSIVLGALFIFDLILSIRNYRLFNRNLALNTIHRTQDLPENAKDQKLFIAAQFWTSADILESHWQNAVLRLIDTLGVENVHLSMVATASEDDTAGILRRLDEGPLSKLNVSRTIVQDSNTHEDAIKFGGFDDKEQQPREGWIYTGDSDPPGRKELRRIPYLADIRNRSLRPLMKLYRQHEIVFDKILFLGDVIFEPSDVLSLLATNGGTFDAACAIDYRLDDRFYDTFVLRDSDFNTAASRYFPIFHSRASRDALLSGFPVPVTSCWNGMMIADAAPYYDILEPLTYPSPFAKADTILESIPGLKFRGIPDSLAASHLEASEACLIHADLIAQGLLTKGIFMNPAVRVGYTRWGFKTTIYDDLHRGPRGLGWVTLSEYLLGIWHNRGVRWFGNGRGLKPSIVSRIDKWRAEGEDMGETRVEVGEYCIIDEMQILTTSGKGWKHIGPKVEYD